MRQPAWDSLRHYFESIGFSHIDDLMQLLPRLSLKQRKAVVLAARSQSFPVEGTSFGDQVLRAQIPERIWEILGYSDMITSPITSNLVIELVLASPMSDAMVSTILKDMVAKEMKVMESEPLPSVLNYRVLFDPSAIGEAIHHSILPNPRMAALVQSRLQLWKQKVTSRALYPRMSSKTVSRETARNVAVHYDELWGWEDGQWQNATHVTLENIYHRTGVVIPGPCELRQKWYRANLVPRTYYSSGGDAYAASKYLQSPFNQLVDILACTERYSRVNPSRLRIPEDKHAIIYDLSSFTSNCHEQTAFLHHLANFCDGELVTVIDTYNGPCELDLGDLIRTYTRVVNECPQYSTERVFSDNPLELEHHVASFLGVFGNIATCTSLHGMVVLQACNSEDELNIAGDDGLYPADSKEDVMRVPRLLGVLALEKTGDATEEGSVHLKRPITQLGSRLIPGKMVIWPSLETIAYDDGMIDPRYPYLSMESKASMRSSVASSIARFLYHLHCYGTMSYQEKDLIHTVLLYAYRRYKLPLRGSVPQCGGDPDTGFVAELSLDNIGKDPYNWTIRSLYRGVALVPVRDRELMDEVELYVGASFRHPGNRSLVLLEKLGYVSKEPLYENVLGEEGLRILLDEFYDPARALYRYSVMSEIPTHLMQLDP